MQQKGFFETGQEDSISSTSEDLKVRIAYREASVAVLACCFPVPYRPFVETNITPVKRASNMSYTSTSGKTQALSDHIKKVVVGIREERLEEIRNEASQTFEEEKEKPDLLLTSHFLMLQSHFNSQKAKL
ncbi:putative inactive ATP-dependent zinc metalloprotease FTSHI 4, chloroplastic [Drosera capensis]